MRYHRQSPVQKGSYIMKVLLLNGSSRPSGCTYTALREVAVSLKVAGIETEILFLGNEPVRDCTACGTCAKVPGKCVFDDDIVNRIIEKARGADGFIFGTPVYYAHPSGRILSVLDRVFYAGKSAFIRCIEAGKAAGIQPPQEEFGARTNFIR